MFAQGSSIEQFTFAAAFLNWSGYSLPFGVGIDFVVHVFANVVEDRVVGKHQANLALA